MSSPGRCKSWQWYFGLRKAFGFYVFLFSLGGLFVVGFFAYLGTEASLWARGLLECKLFSNI